MNSKHICVIIPAYKESKNLTILLPRIIRVIPKATIIVVDDSMGIDQKKTEVICKRYSKSILYISRKSKSGRGSAVLDGMRLSLQQTSCTKIVEMDADLAHNPDEIPLLCHEIGKVDMVVGSRYTKGSIIVQWPLRRLIQSKIINFLLSYWFGLRLTDYTNGFRAYSRKACMYLIKINLREKGFILLSEIAYRLSQKGFIITEVPTTFTDRTYGKSNATIQELFRSLVGIIRLRCTR